MTLKMVQISEATHSLFFSLKRKMEVNQDKNLTADECIRILISNWNQHNELLPNEFKFKVRDLEPSN